MSLKLWKHPATNQTRIYCVLDYPIKAKVWVEENRNYPKGYAIQCFAENITDFPQRVRGFDKYESKMKVFYAAIDYANRSREGVPTWEDLLKMALAEENE